MFVLPEARSNIEIRLLVGFYLFVCLNKTTTTKENIGSNDLLFTDMILPDLMLYRLLLTAAKLRKNTKQL